MKKKILMIISLVILIISLSGCKDNEYESGNYKYTILNGNAYIYELSEEGKKQEVLILPTELEGYKTGLGNYYGMLRGHELNFESDNLNELYFNTSIIKNLYHEEICVYARIYTQTETKLFLPYYNFEHNFDIKTLASNVIYQSYETGNDYIDNIANVSYYYNYDNSHTINWKTYFIDDLDNELITNIPPNPIREGYKFKGWYKEKECINKWDFEKDIIPSKEYDKDGNYIFKETAIYAGWEIK